MNPLIIISTPLNSRESADYYHGFMRFVRENAVAWDVRCLRYPDASRLTADLPRLRPSAIVCSTESHDGLDYPTFAYPEVLLTYARKHRTPFVGLNLSFAARRMPRGKRIALLTLDSRPLGALAAETLLKAGSHRAYGYLCRPHPGNWSRDRFAGFTDTIRCFNGGSVSICRADYDDAETVATWLAKLPKPAAIFAENDFRAQFLLAVCTSHGFRVPDDFTILGVDDDPLLCQLTTPTLSSIHPDFPAVGYAAGRAVADLLAGRPCHARPIAGTPTVTERTSTAPCSPTGLLIRRAEEIIAQEACRGLDASKLAGRLGVSRRLLDLRFQQHTETTVRAAIERVRLARVRALLVETHLSLAEIATSCGFKSLSYLESVFTRTEGKTLQAYRRTTRRPT